MFWKEIDRDLRRKEMFWKDIDRDLWESQLDITLFVAVPEFLEEPENKVMGVEEDVAFKCRAGGRPKPDIQWSINGVPAECKLI